MAKIVIPTRKGYDIVEQTAETKSEKEWKSIFPNSFSDSDKPFTLYKLVKTGQSVNNLEFVCVEPVTSHSVINPMGEFYDATVRAVYNQIVAMAEKRGLPCVALSEEHILTGRPKGFEKFVYLAQFYRKD